MAAKNTSKHQFLGVILIFCGLSSSLARIHRFRIEDDTRQQIDLSTFGFLQGGHMYINVSGFQHNYLNASDQLYGFTLDKTMSAGISPYLANKQDECLLKQEMNKDSSISVIIFTMDFVNMRLNISRHGKDLTNMSLLLLTEELYSNHTTSQARVSKVLSDNSLMQHNIQRRRRDAESKTSKPNTLPPLYKTKPPDGATTQAENSAHVTSVKPGVKSTPVSSTATPTATVPVVASGGTVPPELPPSVNTDNDWQPITGNHSIALLKNGSTFNFHFILEIKSEEEEGLYNFYFHNCHNYNGGIKTKVNFTVELVETNKDNYLSAGEMPLPLLYLAFCFVYLVAALLWLYIIRKSTDGVFKIHYLMLVLTFVKSIALLFHSINTYFIQLEGHHEEAFAILYYITHLMKGALLFITIVLIGAGWAFVKHILSERDKKIFIVVIPLQVLANVAQIIIEETEEGQAQYTTWKQIFILVDLLCCGAILFPVVWSIRHLQEASQTDGKAAINLQKLKIFRHFYILIVCYIYFTRIIVYLLAITVPFQYMWLDELFRELATLAFFVVTGYKFRPASNNPYLQLATDSDDEVEMDQVVTEIGAYDQLTKVNVKSGDKDGSQLAHREASLDYD